MAKRIVVALGGNALGNTPEEQLKLVKNTAKSIVEMTKEGYEVIVGHGNGPQVGMINLAMDYAANGEGTTLLYPLPASSTNVNPFSAAILSASSLL